MPRLALPFVAGCLCCLGLASTAAAQSALERLEKQVRNRGESNAADEKAKPSDDADNTGYLGVVADDRQDIGKGVRIMEVLRGSPAERSGLKADDLVTGVAGKPVRSMEDFARILGPVPAGSRLQFEIKRDKKQQLLDVALGKRPPEEERPFAGFGPIPMDPPAAQEPPRSPGQLGVRVDAVTDEAQSELNLPSAEGALIVHVNPGSPGEEAGLPVSGVIVAINEKQVRTPADLKRLVASAGAGADVLVTYYYEGQRQERAVQLAGSRNAAKPPAAAADRLPPRIPYRAPADAEADARVELLERRIEQLEQRLAELERLIRSGKADAELPPPEKQP